MRLQKLCFVALQVLLVLAVGCSDDDPTGLSQAEVAGSYEATLFRATTGSQTQDVLTEGGSFSIVLNVNGTTTGRLVVPGGGENGGDLDASLAGGWTLSGNTVRFTMAADVFVRDADFTASPSRLTADETFSGTRVQVTLEK